MTESPNDLAVLGPEAALLSEIENLHLRAQLAVQGALAGVHRSRRRGASIEFSEHKLYTPGDDIRHMDWRAFAKTDRYHIKQFEDETNLTLHVLVDHSGSMQFSSNGNMSKLAYARDLAAALCYLALRQGDATGLLTVGGTTSQEVPARATGSHLFEVLRHLVTCQAEGPTRLAWALDRLARTSKRRSLMVIISDLFDPDPELPKAFRRLSARHHDVSVLQLLDPAELHFPYESPVQFASLEDNRRLFVHPRTLRATYLDEFKKFTERTRRQLSEARIDYAKIDTSTSPGQALAAFLRSREGRNPSGRRE